MSEGRSHTCVVLDQDPVAVVVKTACDFADLVAGCEVGLRLRVDLGEFGPMNLEPELPRALAVGHQFGFGEATGHGRRLSGAGSGCCWMRIWRLFTGLR